MSIMNFKRLIDKYADANQKEIIHRVKVGTKVDMKNGGRVIDQFKERNIKGAILRTRGDLIFDNGGYRHEYENRLYCYYKLEEGDHITVNGKRYLVTPIYDYSGIDTNGEGLHIYKLEGDDL